VIALRWALLLAAAAGVLAAVGATDPDFQPSALRVVVAAVLGLLAPLFWPGCAATAARTAARVLVWSAAVAAAAVGLPLVLGRAPQAVPALLACAAMLLAILLPVHAAAAALQAWLHRRMDRADAAREAAGRITALALALLLALPLWLGPAAELVAPRADWAVDAVLAASPLTHLAVASGNDLLRHEWLYQHANLAALQVSYPELATTAGAYAALALALAGLVAWRCRPAAATPIPFPSTQEKSP
jgi:hypothetical protein